MVPFDTESPFVTSGIRIGSPAMTTRGFGTDEFKTIAKLIDKVLQDPDNESVISEVKGQVSELCETFPLYDFITA
jgi:glycine hydroxymethyltransferase